MPAKAGINDFSPGDAPLASKPIPPPSLRAKRSNPSLPPAAPARHAAAPPRHAGEGRHPRLCCSNTSVNKQISQNNAERIRPGICVNLRNLRIKSYFRVSRGSEDEVKAKEFFFEKKNQKTSAPLRAVLKQPGTKTNKVFLLLFVHKKKSFLLYFPSPA
jgi:hypothetical protein